MKRELGFGRCGLACCLCSENTVCGGCGSGGCPDYDSCENRKCSLEKGLGHCYECEEFDRCRKGLLSKTKPRGFSLFARRYGERELLGCLGRNELAGVVYHREGIVGDYDGAGGEEELIELIRTGKKREEC